MQVLWKKVVIGNRHKKVGSMNQTILYMISFCCFVLACIYYPKSEKSNIITDTMICYVMALCYGAFGALILQICKVKIHIVSISIVYLVGAITITLIILKKKKIQKHFIQYHDVIACIIIFIVIAGIGVHIFSRRLEINFGNTVDPSVHYTWAMEIVRNGTVSGMFFAQFHNAMFIEMMMPFFTEITTYKAFILADCFHTLMQCYVFYGIICYVLKKSKYKFLPLIVTALYWFGYPLYSYTMGGYIYWTMGGMLVQFVVFILQVYRENVSMRKLCIIPLVLGAFGCTLCYVQFAPAVFIAIAAVIVFCIYKEKGIVIDKKFISIGLIIGVFFLICALLGYYFVFASRGIGIFYAFSLGTQESRSLEFIIAVPIIYYLIYRAVIEKKMNAYSIAICSFGVVQVGFTLLAMINMVSSYYLFKPYYVFWSLIWLVLLERREYISGKVRRYVINYTLVTVLLLMFAYTPKGEWNTNDAFSLDNSMYRYNAVILKEKDFRDSFMDEVMIELIECAYNINQEQDVQVTIIGSNEIKGRVAWYQGIVNQPAYWISPLKKEFLDEYLAQNNPQYIMVFKDDTGYEDNKQFFDSLEWIFENEKGFIAKFY